MGDLPPSSSATRLTLPEATSLTLRPARVDPVNEIMSISGCAASGSPTLGPSPDTRLNTPAGRPSSWMISARTNALSGFTSLGLTITAQPAVSAGATFAHTWWSG